MQEDNNGTNNWWSRPCGARDVLVLALPLIISTASWTVMNFVDRMFLLWHSTREMAATMPAEFARLREVTVVLLRFVAAYSLLDAMNLMFVGALKGAGDTRFILLVSLITSPLPVLASWAGVTYAGWGLIWCWIVLTVWIWALAVIYFARFLQGRWRQMRVIEPELLPDEVEVD